MNNDKICKYHHTIDGGNISVLFFNYLTGEESVILENVDSLTISIDQDYSFYLYYETNSSQTMKRIQVRRYDKLIISQNNEIIASLNGQMYDVSLSIPLMNLSSSSDVHKSDLAQLFDRMGMADVY